MPSLEYLGTDKPINKTKPLVSVCIPTFQHASYIKECIDSVLSQETNFPIEILIGEDKSLDGTREICMSYADKFPDKIRLFLNDREDVIFIDGKPTGRANTLNLFSKARGEFIALCEGDDYWVDENKLQQQIDFLDKNTEYSFCFSNAYLLLDIKERYEDQYFCEKYCKSELKDTIFFGDITNSHWIPTGSVVFRKSMLNEIPSWFLKVPMGDWALFLLLLNHGPAKYFQTCFSVYRYHETSYWSTLSLETRISKSLQFYEIVRNKFGRKFNLICLSKLVSYHRNKYKENDNWRRKYLHLKKFFFYMAIKLLNKIFHSNYLLITL